MLRIDLHHPREVRAHVTSGTGFITGKGDGDTTATLYLSVEQTREVVAALTRGLAEHDLIAKAKAEAAAQAEAA